MSLAIDGSTTEVESSTHNHTSLTASSITASTGSKRLMVVTCCHVTTSGTVRTASGCTYNGISLTKAVEVTNTTADNTYAAVFYLKDADYPSAGSYDVVATWSDTLANPISQMTVTQLTDANQTTFNTTSDNPDNTNSPDTTIGSLNVARTSFIFDAVSGNNAPSATADSPQISLGTATNGNLFCGASYEDAGTSSTVNLGWGNGVSGTDWCHALLEVIDDSPFTVSPTLLTSTTTFGSESIDKAYGTTALTSTTTFGTPSLDKSKFIFPARLTSTTTFGTPGFNKDFDMTSFTSTTAFGSPSIDKGLSTISFTSTVTFGVPTLGKIWDKVADPTGVFTKIT